LEDHDLAKRRQPAKRPVDAKKQAEKRARRDERKLAEARAKQLALRKRRIRTGLIVLVGVVVIGTAGFLIADRATASELPGVVKQNNEGRTHVETGVTVQYATATPTSGTHSEGAPRCGIFSQQLPTELAIHALEHGTVVIWYQPTLDDGVVTGLRDIVNRFDDRVVLSPNDALTDPVVATAWLRLKAYDGAHPELEEFITIYRGRGPESVPCGY
jgi:cell division septal protein FtsQ